MAKLKKGAFSWAMYDWANSAWATTVLAGFVGVFFASYWGADLPGYAKVAYLGYANSAAALCVFLLAAIIGAIADKGNRKKRMLAGFAGAGIVLTASLTLVQRGDWLLAAVLYAASYVFWLFANIAYDALIVSVSDDEDVDFVSSLGYGMGYAGGFVLFAVNVAMVQAPAIFGLLDANVARLAGTLGDHQIVAVADMQSAKKSFIEQNTAGSRRSHAALLEIEGKHTDAHTIYLDLGKTSEADPEAELVYKIDLQNDIARTSQAAGDLAGAEAALQEAVKLARDSQHERAPHLLAGAYDNLALFLENQDRTEEALLNNQASIDTRRKILGPAADWDVTIIPARQAQVRLFTKQANFTRAETALLELQKIRKKKKRYESEEQTRKAGKEVAEFRNPSIVENYYEYAAYYEARGNRSATEAEYKKAYVLLKDAFDPMRPELQQSRVRLSDFYRKNGDFRSARQYALEAYEIEEILRKSDEGTVVDRPQMLAILQMLIRIANEDGAPAEAEPYHKQLQALEKAYRPATAGVASIFTDQLGTAKSDAVKWSFLSVAVWWIIFMLPLLFKVKDQYAGDHVPLLKAAREGVGEVIQTFKEIRRLKVVLMFLLAYWFYIDGVDTIIAMAIVYGSSIGIGTGDLITALLLVQVVAIPFALLFGWGGKKHGAKTWIFVGIFIYMCITFYASLFLDTRSFFIGGIGGTRIPKFLVLALLVGTAQGGVQALSRSFFARIIPDDRSAEFFGFYNMIGKFAAFIGPALMGWISYVTQDPRLGIASIVILFIIGGGILLFVDEKKGAAISHELEQEHEA